MTSYEGYVPVPIPSDEAASDIEIAGAALAHVVLDEDKQLDPIRPMSGSFTLSYRISSAIEQVRIDKTLDPTDRDEVHRLRAAHDKVKETVESGMGDVRGIFTIANRTLADAHINPSNHKDILMRSGRLIMAASSLSNSEIAHMLESAIERRVFEHDQGNTRPLSDTMVARPMVVTGDGDDLSLRWNDPLQKWIDGTKADGCPFLAQTIDTTEGRKLSGMHLLWQLAVEAEYGQPGRNR